MRWVEILVLTQGYALGWDMAAPLALSKNQQQQKQIPFGNGNKKCNSKSNSKCEYGDLSTAHDMKPSCFGRDDSVWVGWGERSRVARYPTLCKERKG